MEGGAPDGIKMRPGDEGCLTKRKRMRMTTMHGNSSTKPSGTEMDELPFSRIRRRKNDSCGKPRPFSLLKSSRDGMFGVEGIRLTSPCTKPMAGVLFNVLSLMQRLPGLCLCDAPKLLQLRQVFGRQSEKDFEAALCRRAFGE
jgi:hypothetical protein